MIKILITGENSYVGNSFRNYMNKNHSNEYHVDEISVRGDEWKNYDFSPYRVIFHVAGIAHIKETNENEYLYYEVNRDLAVEVAKKAKKDNVKQFIFLSSMSVYGVDQGELSIYSKTNPTTAYGRSKLEAEVGISSLPDNDFKIVTLRPPMIYGPNCKGNYPKLSKLAKSSPIFPNYSNKRSMIFIDNLILYVKNIIDNELTGLYIPQNPEYINTSNLVATIAKENDHNIWLTKTFNVLVKVFSKFHPFNKVFGDLTYVKEKHDVEMISFQETISITERDTSDI